MYEELIHEEDPAEMVAPPPRQSWCSWVSNLFSWPRGAQVNSSHVRLAEKNENSTDEVQAGARV